MENQLLLAVQDAGQVDSGGDGHLGEKIEDHGDGETGYHLQIFFETKVQFRKPCTDA